ncbi:DUF3617 domain-containing protein [Marinimicrobium locisalis]|uniref:DUF3617 domain-containing protein n=1 Tax=Marinimicrobium locisalis TaxID=546022 RepID=UPI0032214BDB
MIGTLTSIQRRLLLPLAGVVFVCGSAQAESIYLKPGTWEMTMQMSSDSGELEKRIEQMEQQLASLPEQSRAMAEEMNPFSLFDGEPRKECMTQKDIDEADFNFAEDPSCENTVSRDGKDSTITLTCPESGTEGKFQIDNGERYTGKLTMPSQFPGISGNLTLNITGKRLKEGCSEALKAE